MSLVTIVDRVTEWARAAICEKIELKAPPPGVEDAMDEAAVGMYQMVHPAAFSMYVPTAEKLPPEILSPIPSVCVRIESGSDSMSANKRSVRLQMCFSAWNPGDHGADIALPENGENGRFWRRWEGAESDAYFRRSGDGWRDAWNFLDLALREVQSAGTVGGYRLDKGAPIEYGPLKDQEGIPDFYPYWFNWLSFSIETDLRRYVPEYNDLL